MSEARASVVEGRLGVAAAQFDDAGRRFAAARALVEIVQMRARETGQAERAGQLEIVLAELKDAERLAMARDSGAETPADRATQALRSMAGGAK